MPARQTTSLHHRAAHGGRSRLIRVAGLATVTGTLAIGLVTGCSSAGQNSSAGQDSSAMQGSSMQGSSSAVASMPDSMAMIHITSFKYQVPAAVSPGATVSVMNMDGETHTVTADSGGAFDVTAQSDRTVTFTAPSKPGSYPFHCNFHANMHGALVVK